jgi:valyl-tRNA synthetase
VLISGHALDPAGKKISKSKLKTADDPTALLEQYSADAVRYWTASVRTGGDTLLSEETIKNGARLVTKLWNAARFVLPHIEGYTPPPVAPPGLNPSDRWLLARLHETVRRATAALEEYAFATAKTEIERFFWADLCDNYLEMIKARLYGDASGTTVDAAAREAARYVLYHALDRVVHMLAPFIPHVTEAIFLAGFAGAGAASIHTSRWPVPEAAWDNPAGERDGLALLEVIDAVRRWKAERRLSVGAPLARVEIRGGSEQISVLFAAMVDLRSVTRAEQIVFETAEDGSALAVTIQHQAGG